MGTLYVTEMGVQVHKEGQRLLVKRGTDVLQDIPMIKVDRVILMGKGASITTPTLYALAHRKVGIFYLSSHGKFVLRTVGEEHNHSRLRQAQTRAVDDPARCMLIAQARTDDLLLLTRDTKIIGYGRAGADCVSLQH